ncbi:MAG: type II toxin-antitoxin system YafQ family toxin [Prevotella sp.]|nr:type II toxin-antitoxin system YafQ family toxin [Prevotella sp.]
MKKYNITITRRFKRNVELCRRRGFPMEKLAQTLDLLIETGSLPAEYRPHTLSGNHAGEWEAHIAPDWLLIWEQNDNELTLLMLSTGTHSDLFGKTHR